MLTEQRYGILLKLLEKKKSITVAEAREILHTSESTVRRDITALHNMGKLTKVFGGAVALEYQAFSSGEPTVAQKIEVNQEEKRKIARYASSLIEPNDFIYVDAGTTTGFLIDYLTDESVTYVTNAVAHAQRLVAKGMQVLLIGGELKAATEAVVGNQAMQMLLDYHFTKGFFGTNGITAKIGFTTPDANEAVIKRTAMKQCKSCFVLSDYSKFGKVSSVTFSPFSGASIITDRVIEGMETVSNIIIAE